MTYTGRHRSDEPFVTDSLATAHSIALISYSGGVAMAYMVDDRIHQIHLPQRELRYMGRVINDALKETP